MYVARPSFNTTNNWIAKWFQISLQFAHSVHILTVHSGMSRQEITVDVDRTLYLGDSEWIVSLQLN